MKRTRGKQVQGRASILDVAARAGVAAMTVSRVLNGAKGVAPATRAKVQTAIEELGYVPNALARGLLTGRTRTIGLLVNDISNPYWIAVASGAEDVVHRAGSTLVLGNIADSAQKEQLLIRAMLSQRVDGLLINTSFREPLLQLIHNDYPFVLIGPEHKGLRADVVRGDVSLGARMLTELFLSKGHRRIALLNGPRFDFESQEREKSYRQTLAEAGITPMPQWVREGTYGFRGGLAQATELLIIPEAERPTAIVASNNFLALSVIEAARALGRLIPSDVALAGFDDFVLASIIDPFLTVVAQPARGLGSQAAQLLLNRITNPGSWSPANLISKPELIIRRSSG